MGGSREMTKLGELESKLWYAEDDADRLQGEVWDLESDVRESHKIQEKLREENKQLQQEILKLKGG